MAKTGEDDLYANIKYTITRGQIDLLANSLPLMIEAQHILAQVRHAKFVALKTAGFTEAQAIELCKGDL